MVRVPIRRHYEPSARHNGVYHARLATHIHDHAAFRSQALRRRSARAALLEFGVQVCLIVFGLLCVLAMVLAMLFFVYAAAAFVRFILGGIS